jgi:transposase
LSVEQLRAAAQLARNTKQGLRILAIAMVLDGHGRHEAAQACGMERQTLRDWVHRYNGLASAGSPTAPAAGAPRA